MKKLSYSSPYQIQLVKKYLLYRYMEGMYDPQEYMETGTELGHMQRTNVNYLIDLGVLVANGDNTMSVHDRGKLIEIQQRIAEKKAEGSLKPHYNFDECIELLISGEKQPKHKKYELYEVLGYVAGYEKANPQNIIEDVDIDPAFSEMRGLTKL